MRVKFLPPPCHQGFLSFMEPPKMDIKITTSVADKDINITSVPKIAELILYQTLIPYILM